MPPSGLVACAGDGPGSNNVQPRYSTFSKRGQVSGVKPTLPLAAPVCGWSDTSHVRGVTRDFRSRPGDLDTAPFPFSSQRGLFRGLRNSERGPCGQGGGSSSAWSRPSREEGSQAGGEHRKRSHVPLTGVPGDVLAPADAEKSHREGAVFSIAILGVLPWGPQGSCVWDARKGVQNPNAAFPFLSKLSSSKPPSPIPAPSAASVSPLPPGRLQTRRAGCGSHAAVGLKQESVARTLLYLGAM